MQAARLDAPEPVFTAADRAVSSGFARLNAQPLEPREPTPDAVESDPNVMVEPVEDVPFVEFIPPDAPAPTLANPPPPAFTPSIPLETAIERLPAAIREGVTEALRGQFVAIIPAPAPPADAPTSASAAEAPLSDDEIDPT